MCTSATLTLSASATGGTWSSSSANATVTSGGVVTGVTAGTAVISYNTSNACGSDVAVKTVTVNLVPDAGTISGSSSVCSGSAISLTSSVTGGAWSSSNANATVNSSGYVAGLAAGTVVISYSVTNECGTSSAMRTLTVITTSAVDPITGTATVCIGNFSTLSNATAGGTWSSSNTAIASVGTSGIVRGVAAGTAFITYRVVSSCGTGVAIRVVTVSAIPSAGTISGATSVCTSMPVTLTASGTGGSWSSSNSNATVSSTGVVTGLAIGTVTISYSVSSACSTAVAMRTLSVSVSGTPDTITGAATGAACIECSIADNHCASCKAGHKT
jgi:uncharacterized protein YjdB